jgi:hypothetical protein
MKRVPCAVMGIIMVMSSCSTYRTENTSVKNAVYILELVEDIPSGGIFSFRDYCAFNAERGAADSILDKTLAEADARLELHFFDKTAELRLESSNEGPAFLEYRKHYASRFFFTEDKNSVELTLRLDTVDEETRAAVEVLSDTERDAILKSVFKKSNDILIEPDEEDEVINYWRKVR